VSTNSESPLGGESGYNDNGGCDRDDETEGGRGEDETGNYRNLEDRDKKKLISLQAPQPEERDEPIGTTPSVLNQNLRQASKKGEKKASG